MTAVGSGGLRDLANVVPSAYRGVAMARIDHPMDEQELVRHFTGREVYRRTRFIVVRDPDESVSLMRVEREDGTPLFSPARDVAVLALPDECAYIEAPEVDTAIPSSLARVAIERAPGLRAVVIQGRYAHVNFIMNARPLRVRVAEVTPPVPAKLFDQVCRLLDVAEDLPPMLPELDDVAFDDLASCAPNDRYLLPCRGSEVAIAGAAMAYLDERPAREPWTLIGCDRSLQIHEWFYGDSPPAVSMCPRRRTDLGDGPSLVKCCLLEDSIEVEGGRVIVPWGASLAQVNEALHELARFWEPTWAPV